MPFSPSADPSTPAPIAAVWEELVRYLATEREPENSSCRRQALVQSSTSLFSAPDPPLPWLSSPPTLRTRPLSASAHPIPSILLPAACDWSVSATSTWGCARSARPHAPRSVSPCPTGLTFKSSLHPTQPLRCASTRRQSHFPIPSHHTDLRAGRPFPAASLPEDPHPGPHTDSRLSAPRRHRGDPGPSPPLSPVPAAIAAAMPTTAVAGSAASGARPSSAASGRLSSSSLAGSISAPPRSTRSGRRRSPSRPEDLACVSCRF